jgi:hypothetical protein
MPVFRLQRGLAAFALIGVLTAPALDAQKKDDKKSQGQGQAQDQSKLSDQQRQELTPLVKTIDEVMKTGTPGTFSVLLKDNAAVLMPDPATVTLGWKNDFLKATGNQIYVPFTVTIDTGKIGSSVAGYLRVVPKGMNSPAPQQKDNKDKKDSKDAKDQPYPFEDVIFTELRAAVAGQPQKLTRAFGVPAGDYDVYLALRDRPAGGDKASAEAPVRITVMKQELTVPNFWSNEFTTSSLILADKVEPLSTQLTPEQQRERPYVLGTAEIVPAPDNKFKKTEELGLIFQVYNYQTGSDGKPDVQIEYVFYKREPAGGEKEFNKTEPQKFNAQTIPADFVPNQSQIVGGQMIPLASFPEGDFRLDIKVIDNKAQKTLQREVLFTVVPSS